MSKSKEKHEIAPSEVTATEAQSQVYTSPNGAKKLSEQTADGEEWSQHIFALLPSAAEQTTAEQTEVNHTAPEERISTTPTTLPNHATKLEEAEEGPTPEALPSSSSISSVASETPGEIDARDFEDLHMDVVTSSRINPTLLDLDLYQDRSDNWKQDVEQDSEFREDIRLNGNVKPVQIVPTDDPSHPYAVVVGHRRAFACLLEGRDVYVSVLPDGLDNVELSIIGYRSNLNARTNEQKPYSNEEVATGILRLHEMGLGVREIHRKTGARLELVSFVLKCSAAEQLKSLFSAFLSGSVQLKIGVEVLKMPTWAQPIVTKLVLDGDIQSATDLKDYRKYLQEQAELVEPVPKRKRADLLEQALQQSWSIAAFARELSKLIPFDEVRFKSLLDGFGLSTDDKLGIIDSVKRLQVVPYDYLYSKEFARVGKHAARNVDSRIRKEILQGCIQNRTSYEDYEEWFSSNHDSRVAQLNRNELETKIRTQWETYVSAYPGSRRILERLPRLHVFADEDLQGLRDYQETTLPELVKLIDAELHGKALRYSYSKPHDIYSEEESISLALVRAINKQIPPEEFAAYLAEQVEAYEQYLEAKAKKAEKEKQREQRLSLINEQIAILADLARDELAQVVETGDSSHLPQGSTDTYIDRLISRLIVEPELTATEIEHMKNRLEPKISPILADVALKLQTKPRTSPETPEPKTPKVTEQPVAKLEIPEFLYHQAVNEAKVKLPESGDITAMSLGGLALDAADQINAGLEVALSDKQRGDLMRQILEELKMELKRRNESSTVTSYDPEKPVRTMAALKMKLGFEHMQLSKAPKQTDYLRGYLKALLDVLSWLPTEEVDE